MQFPRSQQLRIGVLFLYLHIIYYHKKTCSKGKGPQFNLECVMMKNVLEHVSVHVLCIRCANSILYRSKQIVSKTAPIQQSLGSNVFP